MTEINIRRLRQTMINSIRTRAIEIQRELTALLQELAALEQELQNRPNAPEGFVEE